MTTTPEAHAAALATELACLVDLPVEQRGPVQGSRYDELRWALGRVGPAGRMPAYAAAVAAVDPGHVLGPYPDLKTELTIELYAFECWRLEAHYNSDGAGSDVARRLLCVTEPLFHTWSAEDMFHHFEVGVLLRFGHIGADDFPGFSVQDYHRNIGVDLAAREFSKAAYAAAARAVMRGPASCD